uniref:Uncharacterized protein n=1 Tax=Solanum lycopersicum TaxID=4081 RepID=A0A3Q7JUH9_SOLLC
MMACHARFHLTFYAAQEQRSHAMTDVIRSCVLSNGDDGMPCRRHPTVCTVEKSKVDDNIPRPKSSDYVCSPRAIMRWQVTPDIVRLRVLPNADDAMPCSTSSNHVCTIKGNIIE